MKIYRYLMINFFLIFACTVYAGNDYYINLQNFSNLNIIVIPNSHNCIYAFSNKAIIIPIDHTEGIKIRANNSGSCAFEYAEEQFNFKTVNKSKGWIKFSMNGGIYTQKTTGSGTIVNANGQDNNNRWTVWNNGSETATITFW